MTFMFCSQCGNRKGGWSRFGTGQAAGPLAGQGSAAPLQTAQLYQAKASSQKEGAQVLTTVLPFKLLF